MAATILGQNGDGSFNVQHYWVTAGGETITLKRAVLIHKPFQQMIWRSWQCLWGHYRSDISGGTGKFKNATGYLDYFGIAPFSSEYARPALSRGGLLRTLSADAQRTTGHKVLHGEMHRHDTYAILAVRPQHWPWVCVLERGRAMGLDFAGSSPPLSRRVDLLAGSVTQAIHQ